MATMSTNKTNYRKRITIDTKVAIINAVVKREKSNAQICRDFEIDPSTVYTILKDTDKILNALPLSLELYILLYS